MTLHSIPQKPLRIASALGILFLLWIWLTHTTTGTGLADSFHKQYQRPIVDTDTSTGTRPAASAESDLAENKAATPDSEKLSTHGELSAAKPTARVGKVTVAANTLNSPVIHRALKTHARHNEIHGYAHHVAMNEAVSGLIENDRHHRPRGAWTKPAYLLSVLVMELEKPEEERLKWIYWFDADTVILNMQTPLELFLPPEDLKGLDNVDLIITSNWDGLNSGVFGLRVSPWSVSFMSAVLAYPIYKADRLLSDRFRDQSAFQFLLNDHDSPLWDTPMNGKDHWVEVPMRWFNSLPVNNAFFKNGTWLFGKPMAPEMFDKGTNEVFDDGQGGEVKPWKVMQGDMVIHFAGSSYVRDSWMTPWVERAEAELPEWSNPQTQIDMKKDIENFWKGKNKKLTKERAKSDAEEAQKKKDREEAEKKKKEEEERKKKENS